MIKAETNNVSLKNENKKITFYTILSFVATFVCCIYYIVFTNHGMLLFYFILYNNIYLYIPNLSINQRQHSYYSYISHIYMTVGMEYHDVNFLKILVERLFHCHTINLIINHIVRSTISFVT